MQGKNSRTRIAKPLADIRRRTVMRFTKLKNLKELQPNISMHNIIFIRYKYRTRKISLWLLAYNIVGNEWICKKKIIAGWQSFNET